MSHFIMVLSKNSTVKQFSYDRAPNITFLCGSHLVPSELWWRWSGRTWSSLPRTCSDERSRAGRSRHLTTTAATPTAPAVSPATSCLQKRNTLTEVSAFLSNVPSRVVWICTWSCSFSSHLLRYPILCAILKIILWMALRYYAFLPLSIMKNNFHLWYPYVEIEWKMSACCCLRVCQSYIRAAANKLKQKYYDDADTDDGKCQNIRGVMTQNPRILTWKFN